MSRARELAKFGGSGQQVIAGLSSHVGISTFAADVFMFDDLTVSGNLNVTGDLTYDEVSARNQNITGITTVVDLIVSRNTSVAGILTATKGLTGNINSTGVSTAAFLQATSVNASGIITASSFSGSGSGITGLINSNLSGSAGITNANLANSTISGVALGSNLNALTISTGLSGSSYNGSGAVTIAIDSTVATLTGTQTLTNKTLTSPTLTTPVLGTPSSGTLTNCTFPTLNQNTTGTASNITAYTINQNVGTANAPSFAGMTFTGNVAPNANNTIDLGSSANRWANVYSNDLDLSNEGSANSIDGTWGSYLVQEGEEHLYIINRRSGKKFRFMFEEV